MMPTMAPSALTLRKRRNANHPWLKAALVHCSVVGLLLVLVVWPLANNFAYGEDLTPYSVDTQPYVMDDEDFATSAVALDDELLQSGGQPTEGVDATPLDQLFDQQNNVINSNLITRVGLSFLLVLGLLAAFFKWVFPKLVSKHRQQQTLHFQPANTHESASPAPNQSQQQQLPQTSSTATNHNSLWGREADRGSEPPLTPLQPTAPDQYPHDNATATQPHPAYYSSGQPQPPPPIATDNSTAAPYPSATPSTMASFGLGSVPSTVLKRFTIKKHQVAEFVTVWDRYFLVAATPEGSVLLAEVRSQGGVWSWEPSQVPIQHPAANWLYQYPQLLDDCLASLQPAAPTHEVYPSAQPTIPVHPQPAAMANPAYRREETHQQPVAYTNSYGAEAFHQPHQPSQQLADKYLTASPYQASQSRSTHSPAQPQVDLSQNDAYWMTAAAAPHQQPPASPSPKPAVQPSHHQLQTAIRQQVQAEVSALMEAGSPPSPVSASPSIRPAASTESYPSQRFQPDIHSQHQSRGSNGNAPVSQHQATPPTAQLSRPTNAPVNTEAFYPSTQAADSSTLMDEVLPAVDDRPNDVPDFLGAPPAKMAVRRLKQLQQAGQPDKHTPVTPEPNPRPAPPPAQPLSERIAQGPRSVAPTQPSHPHEHLAADDSLELLDDFDDNF